MPPKTARKSFVALPIRSTGDHARHLGPRLWPIRPQDCCCPSPLKISSGRREAVARGRRHCGEGIVRQLYDFKYGTRAGVGSALMRASAEKLAVEDMLALAAYAGS